MANDTSPNRRWFRFSLRGLLLAVALIAVLGSAILVALRPYQDELLVRRRIQELGGVTEVRYVGPDWLRGVLREGDLEITVRAEYAEGDATEFFHLLKGLPHLELVRTAYATVSDSDLQVLGEKESLQDVTLWHAPITDVGLKKLARAPQLRALSLGETDISSYGLSELARLKNLELLDLSNTRIGDDGLHYLKELPRLRDLFLGGTGITDSGVDQLQEISTLEKLGLQNNPNVTDGAVSVLERLTNLRELDIWDTAITDDGARRLQRALPNTLVRH